MKDRTPVDVVLVLGQSNATGYQHDTTTDYRSDDFVLAYDGSHLLTYRPTVLTGVEGGVVGGHWAAELRYIEHYRASFAGKRLVVLRYTAPGTQLAAGVGVLDWNSSSHGELFDGARAYVRSAWAAMQAQGLRPRLRLVWWQQGEQDAGDRALASSYRANLTAFVAALRDPAGGFAVPSSAPIVIGRLSNGIALLGAGALVRTAQIAVGHASVGGPQILLDDDDLPTEVGDGLHLTKDAQLTLGDRLWSIDQRAHPEP